MKVILDKTAYIVSGITSPFIVVTTIGLVIIAFYAPAWQNFFIWGGTFFFLSIAVPFLYIYHGVKTGKLTDMHLMIKEQRKEPFLLSIAVSLLLVLAFYLENVPYELMILSYVLLVNATIFFLITQFWKISIHSASLAGSIIIISVMIDLHLLLLFLASPIEIWARVRRHRHNAWQGLAATMLAALVTLSIFKIFRII